MSEKIHLLHEICRKILNVETILNTLQRLAKRRYSLGIKKVQDVT